MLKAVIFTLSIVIGLILTLAHSPLTGLLALFCGMLSLEFVTRIRATRG